MKIGIFKNALKNLIVLYSKLKSTPTRTATLESVIVGIIGQILLLISGIFTARLLGVEGRGQFALLTLFPHLLVQLCSFGLPQALLHTVAQDIRTISTIFKNYQYFICIQICLAIMIHAIILHFNSFDEQSSEEKLLMYLTLCATFGLFLQQYGLATFQGMHKFTLFNISRLLNTSLFALFMVIYFYLEKVNLIYVILAWSGIQLLSGIIIYFFVKKEVQEIGQEKIVYIRTKHMLSFGLRGMIGYNTPLESLRLDQLFVGIILTPTALGVYVVAKAFTNLPRIIARSISMIAFPTISSNNNSSDRKIKIIKFILITMAINIPITVLLVIIMPYLIIIFYGEEYSGSTLLAQILIVGALFFSLRCVLTECMRGASFPQISTYAELLMYPILFAIGIFIIPKYDVLGVALTVTITYVINLILIYIWLMKKYHEHDKHLVFLIKKR